MKGKGKKEEGKDRKGKERGEMIQERRRKREGKRKHIDEKKERKAMRMYSNHTSSSCLASVLTHTGQILVRTWP